MAIPRTFFGLPSFFFFTEFYISYRCDGLQRRGVAGGDGFADDRFFVDWLLDELDDLCVFDVVLHLGRFASLRQVCVWANINNGRHTSGNEREPRPLSLSLRIALRTALREGLGGGRW